MDRIVEKPAALKEEINPRQTTAGAGLERSILGRKENGVVCEVEGDLIEREVGVFDFFGENDLPVAVIARQR